MMGKYRCEKGKKQYEFCKKYDSDYCSDCPHGIKEITKEDYVLTNINLDGYYGLYL